MLKGSWPPKFGAVREEIDIPMEFKNRFSGGNLLGEKIGFVGTGMMGDPMAQNLLKAGINVMVYDIKPEATKNVMALGARLVQSPSEMACCDIVFIMVNTGSQVENLLLGKQGIVQGFKGEQLLRLVIMSTISPNLIKRIAHMIGSKNIAIVDAPVSGGIGAAQHGLLAFMVGGPEDIVASIKPYLQVMGKNIFYIGPLGSGLAIKLLNNILGITNLYLFPEVLRLGLKAGLDIKTMVEVFRVSTAHNWCSDQWNSYLGYMEPLVKDSKSHETLNSIVIKDIQTALELAGELGYESAVLKAVFSMVKSGVESTGAITEDLFKEMVNAKIDPK